MDTNEVFPSMKITARERQILCLLAKGKSTKAMASELNLSPETIIWYRKQLHRKFGVHSTAELLMKAVEYKLL